MRRLLPSPARELPEVRDLADHYAYPVGATVRANMVTSVDGAVTLDGRSRGVSSAPDWRLFGLQRALADVILVGAGTARTEGYGPGRVRPEFAELRQASGLPPAPALAIVTRSGDLDPHADFFGGTTPTLVITCESAANRLAALSGVSELLICGQHDVDLATAIAQLTGRGFRRILTEGGPHLLGALVTADLLDEVASSVTPVIAGGDSSRMLAAAPPASRAMQLGGVLEEDGTLFLHYRRSSGEQAPS